METFKLEDLKVSTEYYKTHQNKIKKQSSKSKLTKKINFKTSLSKPNLNKQNHKKKKKKLVEN